MKKLLRYDWDLIAGIVAAVIALVLHLLHIVDQEVLTAVTLFLIALLLLRDLRAERQADISLEVANKTRESVDSLLEASKPPDAILIGPQRLREESERFARNAHGEVVWFNVCLLMFKPQDLFDILVKPVLDNKDVTTLRFIIDKSQKKLWSEEVLPKIEATGKRKKVEEPIWRNLPQTISFILAGQSTERKTHALLSFWGEPFMSSSTGKNIPRYIFHIPSHSELIARFSELERNYRLASQEEENNNS